MLIAFSCHHRRETSLQAGLAYGYPLAFRPKDDLFHALMAGERRRLVRRMSRPNWLALAGLPEAPPALLQAAAQATFEFFGQGLAVKLLFRDAYALGADSKSISRNYGGSSDDIEMLLPSTAR